MNLRTFPSATYDLPGKSGKYGVMLLTAKRLPTSELQTVKNKYYLP